MFTLSFEQLKELERIAEQMQRVPYASVGACTPVCFDGQRHLCYVLRPRRLRDYDEPYFYVYNLGSEDAAVFDSGHRDRTDEFKAAADELVAA